MYSKIRALTKSKLLLAGVFLMSTLAILAIFSPYLTRWDPIQVNYDDCLSPPSSIHPFGTDELGRDLFTRILFGTRIAFRVGFIAVAISSIVGIPLGLVSGYYGGAIDMIVSRVFDAFFAFPFILLALTITIVLGASETTAMIAVGIAYIPSYGRIARAAVISVREETFLEAARAIGASNRRIIIHTVLPNCIGPILVIMSLGFGYAVLSEAALSFIGIGTKPPAPAWGLILASGKRYVWEAPWYSLFPGLAIFLLVLSTNLIGEGLRNIIEVE